MLCTQFTNIFKYNNNYNGFDYNNDSTFCDFQFVGEKLMYVVRKLMVDNDGEKKIENCLIISHNVFCVDALSVCPLWVGIH